MDVSNSIPSQGGSIRDQSRVNPLDQAQRASRAASDPSAEPDRASISDRARLLQKLAEAVDESPDVREEKVEALRDAVQQGRYQISYEEIARAMLASRLRNE